MSDLGVCMNESHRICVEGVGCSKILRESVMVVKHQHGHVICKRRKVRLSKGSNQISEQNEMNMTESYMLDVDTRFHI